MRTTFPLNCTDRYGNTAPFVVECEANHEGDPERATWDFRVRPEGASATCDFFLLTIAQLDANNARIITMNHHYDPGVRAKGIPDALIPAAAAHTGLAIQSSPTKGEGNVSRNDNANRVWRRLVAKGLAAFDEQEDVFRLR